MTVEKVVFLAVVVEAVVNLFMSVYNHKEGSPFYKNIEWKLIASLIVGEFVAFGFGIDITEIVGIPPVIQPAGLILTGLLLGRGSNFVHDLFSLVKSGKEMNQERLKSL